MFSHFCRATATALRPAFGLSVLWLAGCSGAGIPVTAPAPAVAGPQAVAVAAPAAAASTSGRQTQDAVAMSTAAVAPAGSYDADVLALDPYFYYRGDDRSGSVAADLTPAHHDGSYVAPVTFDADGCCGNRGVAFPLTTIRGASAQLVSAVDGSSVSFRRPFALGLSMRTTPQTYPGYGTYWFAGTDSTENGTGNGWDFTFGTTYPSHVIGYTLSWRYGGVATLTYPHALITGNHQWVVDVSATSVGLYLDGRRVAAQTLSQPFEINDGRQHLAFGNTTINPSQTCRCSMSNMFYVEQALSDAQISSLQSAALSNAPASAPPASAPPASAPPASAPPATTAPTAAPTATAPATAAPTPRATSVPAPPGRGPGPIGLPSPTASTLTYNASTACVNHNLFTNNVLPANVGEFATSGFNTAFWGGTKSRTQSPTATWGPGFYQSWGRHQYDTNFGDPSQGPGFPNPFAMVNDGGTQALQISAYPVPAPIATSLDLMVNDQYVVANATQNIVVPGEGGSLTINVDNPNGAQMGWKVGIGFKGAANTFVGTLTRGGAIRSGNGTGGSNPWTISNIHVYTGTPGATLVPSENRNDYALRSYAFPDYYSGALDTNLNQQYGFFVARMRLPNPAPGLSPAFWMLETGGVHTNNGQLMRSEWDIEEQFANDYGYELNAGNILWNSGNSGPWYSYGCGLSCGPSGTTAAGSTGVYPWSSTGNYNSGYHDYGVLVSPGGPAFPTDYAGGHGGVYAESNSPWVGTTFFLDGRPIAGHIGQPDLTQGSPDKELMLMFQIGQPGSFLDANGQAKNNAWPQNLYVQWIRAYKPAGGSC